MRHDQIALQLYTRPRAAGGGPRRHAPRRCRRRLSRGGAGRAAAVEAGRAGASPRGERPDAGRLARVDRGAFATDLERRHRADGDRSAAPGSIVPWLARSGADATPADVRRVAAELGADRAVVGDAGSASATTTTPSSSSPSRGRRSGTCSWTRCRPRSSSSSTSTGQRRPAAIRSRLIARLARPGAAAPHEGPARRARRAGRHRRATASCRGRRSSRPVAPAGVEWYVVEQDDPRDALNDVAAGRRYLAGLRREGPDARRATRPGPARAGRRARPRGQLRPTPPRPTAPPDGVLGSSTPDPRISVRAIAGLLVAEIVPVAVLVGLILLFGNPTLAVLAAGASSPASCSVGWRTCAVRVRRRMSASGPSWGGRMASRRTMTSTGRGRRRPPRVVDLLPAPTARPLTEPWWRRGVLYEIYTRSFGDATVTASATSTASRRTSTTCARWVSRRSG